MTQTLLWNDLQQPCMTCTHKQIWFQYEYYMPQIFQIPPQHNKSPRKICQGTSVISLMGFLTAFARLSWLLQITSAMSVTVLVIAKAGSATKPEQVHTLPLFLYNNLRSSRVIARASNSSRELWKPFCSRTISDCDYCPIVWDLLAAQFPGTATCWIEHSAWDFLMITMYGNSINNSGNVQEPHFINRFGSWSISN